MSTPHTSWGTRLTVENGTLRRIRESSRASAKRFFGEKEVGWFGMAREQASCMLIYSEERAAFR